MVKLTPEMVTAVHVALQRHFFELGLVDNLVDLELAVRKIYLAMERARLAEKPSSNELASERVVWDSLRPPIEELGDGSEDE